MRYLAAWLLLVVLTEVLPSPLDPGVLRPRSAAKESWSVACNLTADGSQLIVGGEGPAVGRIRYMGVRRIEHRWLFTTRTVEYLYLMPRVPWRLDGRQMQVLGLEFADHLETDHPRAATLIRRGRPVKRSWLWWGTAGNGLAAMGLCVLVARLVRRRRPEGHRQSEVLVITGCMTLGLLLTITTAVARQLDDVTPGIQALLRGIAHDWQLVYWGTLMLGTTLIPVAMLSLRHKRFSWPLGIAVSSALCLLLMSTLPLRDDAVVPVLVALAVLACGAMVVFAPDLVPALRRDRCNCCDYDLSGHEQPLACPECGQAHGVVLALPLQLRWRRTLKREVRCWLVGATVSSAVLGGWYLALMLYAQGF